MWNLNLVQSQMGTLDYQNNELVAYLSKFRLVKRCSI
jgi:hypothetical protein